MKILLVGSGGREHALAWKIAQSPLVDALYAAPGNPGLARHATLVPIGADALDDLVAFADRTHVDLVVVGPEAPLVAGLADALTARGLPVFGPSAAAARIEGSKAYAKALMTRHRVPTARCQIFTDPVAARRFCRELGAPVVVKADGLAAGKGVIVCQTLEEADRAVSDCMEQRRFGASGAVVVVEEFLRGEEISFFAVVNGTEAMPLAEAQDHKTVFDGDCGPNTGGMGAFSPVPGVDAALAARIMTTIVRPIVRALAEEGAPYRGVLFAGLMLMDDGPKVIEFNCRFGDPECQAILPRVAGDIVPWLAAAARGDALPAGAGWRREAAVCVSVASGGYPGAYATGLPIAGVDAAEAIDGVHVFHAGTAMRDRQLVTSGGRVLGVTALGPTLDSAIARAYKAVDQIRFDGMHFRRDIGRRRSSGSREPEGAR